jgi:hypothetical protein
MKKTLSLILTFLLAASPVFAQQRVDTSVLTIQSVVSTNVNTSTTLTTNISGVSRLKITPTAPNLIVTLPLPLVTDSGKLLYVENGSATNSMTLNGELLAAGKLTQFIAGTFGGVLQWRAVGGGSGGSAVALGVQSEVEAENIIKAATPKLVNDNRQGLNAVTLPGATDTIKIDAALAAGAASGLPVWLDRQLSSATSSATTLQPNITLFDTRGGGAYDYTANFSSSYANAFSLSRKSTTAPAAPANPTLFHLYQHALTGGRNSYTPPSTYDKVNYTGMSLHQLLQTQGQANGFSVSQYKPSMGDSQGIVTSIFNGGRSQTGGDEGVKLFSGSYIQITDIFTATVAAIDGAGVMNYTSPIATYTRGEGRSLINTSAGIYSTGTISGISAASPPVVTGTGTTWTSLGAVGAVTGLYFAMDQDVTTYGYKHVWRVRSINSDTSITLDSVGIGTDTGFPVLYASYTNLAYKIYKGSEITTLADNSLTVATPASFAAGNNVEQPIARGQSYTGIAVVSEMKLPHASASGIAVNNGNSPNVPLSNGIVINGKTTTGIIFNDTLMTRAIVMNNNPTDSVINVAANVGTTAVTNFFRWINGNGAPITLAFNREATAPYGYLTMGGSWGVNTNGEMALGTTPIVGVKMTIQGAGSQIPLYTEHSNAAADELARFNVQGIPRFNIFRTRTMINNGAFFHGYSDNQATETFRIRSSNGEGDFTSLRLGAGSGTGATWTKGAGTPAGACTTGSIYSNTTGGAATSFYVCESSAWVAK